MSERRKSPRARCGFDCIVQRGREQIGAHLLDVSSGGLCLLAPVMLGRETIALQIYVPGIPPVEVEAEAWHLRRVESQTGTTAWCIGLMISKAGDGFEKLLPENRDSEFVSDSDAADEARRSLGLHVFRVRAQLTASKTTRLLTLGAVSASEARALAVSDLGEDWIVIEVYAV